VTASTPTVRAELPPYDGSSAGRPRHSTRRRLLGALLALVALGAAVLGLAGSQEELGQAADTLQTVRIGWVGVCVAAELAAFALVGAGLRVLLVRRPRPGLPALTAISVSAQAAASCLPGGAALAGVVSYRQLRHRRVRDADGAAACVVSSATQAAALPALALVAAELPGGDGPIPGLRAAGVTVLVIMVLLVGVLVVLRRRHVTARLVLAAGRLYARGRAALGRSPGQSGGESPVAGLARRVAELHIGRRRLGVAGALSGGYWVADALCLAAAFPAVGAPVPWRGLLLSYTAAQLASVLPITPGGLGVVEGSLTVGLVAFGGSGATALAAVLLYRLVSFWGLLPAGALAWAGLRLTSRPGGRS